MKNVLVCVNASPFDGMRIREALDMTLIFAAVDQDVSLLLSGPAVLCLKSEQNPQTLGLKDYFKTLKTLSIYDVDKVYACRQSLEHYALDVDSLLMPVTPLTLTEQSELLKLQDQVVTL